VSCECHGQFLEYYMRWRMMIIISIKAEIGEALSFDQEDEE
jgi:hypothetical protein